MGIVLAGGATFYSTPSVSDPPKPGNSPSWPSKPPTKSTKSPSVPRSIQGRGSQDRPGRGSGRDPD